MATEAKARPAARAFDRFFHLSENRTTWKREILAGTTTFLAMAYILAVNPIILGDAGMPAGGVFAATAVAAATGCLVMGLWARYPIAQAPGMGLNAFFAYTVVLTMGIDWQVALAGTFISGALFFVLAVTGVREMIVNAIPTQMKLATGAGIGLFIAFIGLQKAGIVADDPATLVTLGDFRSGPTLLALFGLVATVVFLVLGWKGAVFYGLIATTALGVATGVTAEAADLTPDFASTFGQGITHLPEAFTGQMVVVILTMLFVDFFDTSGTLFAVAGQAGMLKDGKLPRAGRAMASDSVATMAGAVFGTSTTTSYIESSSGVAVGGRTGLTAVTTGAWFLVSLVAFPVVGIVAGTDAIIAPALIVVGVLMAKQLGGIEWDRLEFAVPAFLTLIAMPLTYSIANGIALGLVFYPLVMITKGRWREVHPIMYGLLLVFVGYFFFLH